MQMLNVHPESRAMPALPGVLLHVIAWAPQAGKLVPTERPYTLLFPVIGWRDMGLGIVPIIGGEVGRTVARALANVEAVDYRAAIETGGMVYEYDIPKGFFWGSAHASLTEWLEESGVADRYGGLAKKDWDKAVKENRERPALILDALYAMHEITIFSPTPLPMTPAPLPSENPIPEVPAIKPGTIPGPGTVTETPEEIAEARRNMARIREAGIAEPADEVAHARDLSAEAVEGMEDDDAASLV